MNRIYLRRWRRAGAAGRRNRRAFRTELWIGAFTTLITAAACAGFLTASLAGPPDPAAGSGPPSWTAIAEFGVCRALMGLLLLSALVYQITRLGYLARFLNHRPATAGRTDDLFRGRQPAVTILVPSYKEEPRVVRRTLLSAALQPVPGLRVALLLDDPPAYADAAEASRARRTRALAPEIDARLSPLAARCRRAAAEIDRDMAAAQPDRARQAATLASCQRAAAAALESLAGWTAPEGPGDHEDALFVERILRAPARLLRRQARELEARPLMAGRDLRADCARLAAMFSADLTVFERKRYANLSHEPNKAMNLNSYIGLMGGRYVECLSPEGLVIQPAGAAPGAIEIPAADYLIILDADSLLLPEYAPRLLRFMGRPENARVAVVQTPYAAVPGAATDLERIAGATTDVQLMAHQGSSLFGAGSWVGASALVRRAALDQIAVVVEERGHRLPIFIRDRTLNEDTDTTVDLIRKGWSVHNYPERLAHSATPRDFGALVIQRRRWATGGLIILPNVVRHLLDRPTASRLGEVILRAQYILGAPLGSVAILGLMFAPSSAAFSVWAWPAFVAWLFSFGRDLRHNGHRASDLGRAMALNAMLLPVSFAGAIHSIRQCFTGCRIPFQRTPKVDERTAAPPSHILAQCGLLLWSGGRCLAGLDAGSWSGALFFGAYALAFGYALRRFIGWRAAADDCLRGLVPSRPVLPAGRPSLRAAHRPLRRAAVLVCLAAVMLGYAGWALARIASPAGPPPRREAAVTFDDLPLISVTPLDARAKSEITAGLLSVIGRHGIPAIGFVNEYELHGFRTENTGDPDPDGVALLERWLDAGLLLGNHTFAHVDLHKTTVDRFEQSIVDGETVTKPLMQARGRPMRWFRYPYLHTGLNLQTRRQVEAFLAARGYRAAPVTIDNEDWLFAAAYSRAAARGDAALMERIGRAYVDYTEAACAYSERLSAELFGRGIRQILLVHANALNAAWFDEVARMMERRGYTFVPIGAALDDAAYATADTYTGAESLNWLARWAIARGARTESAALDELPDVPEFVQTASGT